MKFDIFCCLWSGHLCKYSYVYIYLTLRIASNYTYFLHRLIRIWRSLTHNWLWAGLVYILSSITIISLDYAEQSEGKLSALAHSKMEHHCWVANSNSALSPSLHSKVLQPTVKPNDAHTHALVGYTKRWTPEDLIGIDKKSPTKTFQA